MPSIDAFVSPCAGINPSRVGVASKLGSEILSGSDSTIPGEDDYKGQDEEWWNRPLSLNSTLPTEDCDMDEDPEEEGADDVSVATTRMHLSHALL